MTRPNPDDRPAGRGGRATDTSDRTDADAFDVPTDADALWCDHCGQPFVRERHLALHRGLAHADDLTADERAAFDAARDAERDDLRRFRIVALGALVVVYFGFLFAYALVP